MGMLEDFTEICESITRPGSEKLLKWVLESDFVEAPASTKFHGTKEGDLLVHSMYVYDILTMLNDQLDTGYDEDTIKICALFHDVCKIDYYVKEKRNKKINGTWKEVLVWGIKDLFPMGHGEKSVYLINKHMVLTDDEALAIRWHLGSADAGTHFFWPSGAAEKQAFREVKLVSLLNTADILASYIFDEWENNDASV